MANREYVDWEDFICDVVARLKDDGGSKVVNNSNKLSQMGSLEDYIDAFEDAKSALLQIGHSLPKEPLNLLLKPLNPRTFLKPLAMLGSKKIK